MRKLPEIKREIGDSFVLTMPNDTENFIIYKNAFRIGLDCVLVHNRRVIAYAFQKLKEDEVLHNRRVIAYAFQKLKEDEKKYLTPDL